MAKRKSYEVPRELGSGPKVVTSLEGRPLESIPKGAARHAAKRAVDVAFNKNPWDDAHQDPEVLRRQAHIAANSRRRGKPTRGSERRRAINEY